MQVNSTPYKVLVTLANGHFHSGEELGKNLKLTRSAIWKAIRQLEKCGVKIDSVVGKGYRIVGGMDLLDQTAILQALSSQTAKQLDELFVLPTVDSTNDFLLSKANSGDKRILACIAETQTHGKGRRDRHWQSPFGTNLYFSLLWHFDKISHEVIGASQAVAIALIRALKKCGVSDQVQLKWPNDILWNYKKIAGVLSEISSEQHGHCSLVIGIGINTAFPSLIDNSIDQPYSDLSTILQRPISRNHLATILLDELFTLLPQFSKQGLLPFLDEWKQHDAFLNKSIKLQMNQREITGTVQGLSPQGELILVDQQGKTQHYLTGFIEQLRANL